MALETSIHAIAMAGSPPKSPPPAPFPSHPSNAELIDSYLRPWVDSGIKAGEFIHEADPYGVAPGVLTGLFPSATAGDGGEAWYFFTKLQYRNRAKDRVKRTVDTKEGTWVSSNPARPVRSGGEGPQVGQSQAFAFKRMVRNKQVLSGWNMVELRLRASDTNALCKVYRNPKAKADDEASASAGVAAAPGRGEAGEEIDEEAAAAGTRLKRKAGDDDPGAETAAASPGVKRAAVGESAGAGAATTGDAAEEVEAPAEPEEPDDPRSKPKYHKFL